MLEQWRARRELNPLRGILFLTLGFLPLQPG